MEGMDDQRLVELLRESNYPSFDEIHSRYWKYVYTIAYAKTGDKDHAFDLCQSVFIDLFQKREKIEINLPLKNYLRTAILYKIAGHFRTRGFQEKHYRKFQEFLMQNSVPDRSVDPFEIKESNIAFEQLLDMVYSAIEEMPDRMKTIFLLSREENKSISQIAETLQVSPQTVKNQLSRSSERIRNAVFKQGVPSPDLLFIVWLICS